jgi:hypothetical protein
VPSVASAAISGAASGSQNNTVSWLSVAGAIGYRVLRGTTAADYEVDEFLVLCVGRAPHAGGRSDQSWPATPQFYGVGRPRTAPSAPQQPVQALQVVIHRCCHPPTARPRA